MRLVSGLSSEESQQLLLSPLVQRMVLQTAAPWHQECASFGWLQPAPLTLWWNRWSKDRTSTLPQHPGERLPWQSKVRKPTGKSTLCEEVSYFFSKDSKEEKEVLLRPQEGLKLTQCFKQRNV